MLGVWEQQTWVLLYSPCSIYYVPIYLFIYLFIYLDIVQVIRDLSLLSRWLGVRSLTPPKLLMPLLTYITEEMIAACELSP
jgi:hypothetical protein